MMHAMLIKNADNGDEYTTVVESNPFNPGRVRVTFDNHFSIDVDLTDAERLVEALRSAIDAAGSEFRVSHR
jgi:hypothetical protein